MAADDLIHRIASLDGVLGENPGRSLLTFGPTARLAKGVAFNLDLGDTVVRAGVISDPVLGEAGGVEPGLVQQSGTERAVPFHGESSIQRFEVCVADRTRVNVGISAHRV